MDVICIIPSTIAFIVVVVGSRIGRAVVIVIKMMLSVLVILATAPEQEGDR